MSKYDHVQMKAQIGVSSLKMFDGEDLNSNDRKIQQQNQMNGWVQQQIKDHQLQAQLKKQEKEANDQQIYEQNQLRAALEEEQRKRRIELAIAQQQSNVRAMKEKLDREQEEERKSQKEKNDQLNYIANHSLWTEDTQTCQSQLAPHRVIPYHYKGMSDQQRNEIRNQQALQREQKLFTKQQQKEDEQMWAQYNEHNRKLLVTLEREKAKKQKDIMNFTKESNLLSREEQKIKIRNMYQ